MKKMLVLFVCCKCFVRIRAHEEKDAKVKDMRKPEGAIPAYLLDRDKI